VQRHRRQRRELPQTDCRDPDCDLAPACAENCTDGVDNDADGLADCADPACSATAAACQEQCTNDVDDDGNFLADCLDPDCDLDPACAEDCVDGRVDDDGDGRFDCLDPYCTPDPTCGAACPAFDLGDTVPVTAVGDTFGGRDALTPSCGFGGLFGAASDATFTFTAPADGDYLFDSRGTSFAAVLTVLDGDCGGPELICESGAFSDNPIVTVTLSAGQTVVAVVDGSDYTQSGGYTLNVYAAP
jgi:hypothetical protein